MGEILFVTSLPYSLIILFQHESLLELVYTQQGQILTLRNQWDCREVVDLTLDSDSEGSTMPLESTMKVVKSAPEDSDHSLAPIEEGHSMKKQCCVCSLRHIKQVTPYRIVTGVHHDRGTLQLLESGSCSDSVSS